jgi:hypothetical protein
MDIPLVNDFLDQYRNLNTRKVRYYDLKRVEDLLGLSQKQFLDEIVKLDLKPASFKSSLAGYIQFLKFFNYPTDILEQFYREEKLIYTPKQNKVVDEITLEELQVQLEYIEDNNERLVLSLYLLYPALRSDVFFIKHRNFDETAEPFYENGVIYFPILKKVKRNKIITLTLDKTTRKLVENNINNTDNDYLIQMPTDRNNSKRVSEFLQRITYKNFKIRMSINDFRKLHVHSNEKQIKRLPLREQGRKRVELSKQMGHSLLSQQLSYNTSNYPV